MAMDLEIMKKFLFKYAMRGKWEDVVRMYSADKRAHAAIITKLADTALHIAVSDGQETVVERLLKIISLDKSHYKKVLQLENDRSHTPLHIAATVGSVKMCYDIASDDPSLIEVRNKDGETPLFSAALHGNKNAFLCLHSFCSTDHDQMYFNCRRSRDGVTILHSAIMGDYFDLAFHITKLYNELVNSVNVHGFTPLHLLAMKPSAFESGCHFGRWKMIIYNCIFVDRLKVDPKSYLRALPPKKQSTQSEPHEIGYPENYRTCMDFFHNLWKGIQVVICKFVSKKKKSDEGKARDNADAENPSTRHHTTIGSKLFPENYSTCFNFFKFLSKAMLVILGMGFEEIKKIQDKKEKHTWSLQVMEQLLKCASMYEYDDNGSAPVSTKEPTKDDETKPYGFVGGDVTLVDKNISEHQSNQHAQPSSSSSSKLPKKLDDNNEGKAQEITDGSATSIVIRSKNSVAEKILMHFPMTIQHIQADKKMVITVDENGKTKEYECRLKETPVLIAAKNGVVEMVDKILDLFPVAIHDMNVDRKNIVLLAVENRQPHVYQLLLNRNIQRESVFRKVDREGNSALHLAAKLGDRKPWLIPGAALQMQWELKWYQFVKESMPLNYFPRYNNDGNTPKVVFTETHKELVKSGGEWLINTSQSCSVVAALIATVAFATSATIPGGNDQTEGTPLLKNQPAFDVFAIASVIALCFSVTSVVMFLAILTSRFQEKDFRTGLPTKLIVGLSTLFGSIAAMLVSFCGGHFYVLKDRLEYAALPVYGITCLPITLFAIAQFPLYFDLVWATLKRVPQRSYKVILSN